MTMLEKVMNLGKKENTVEVTVSTMGSTMENDLLSRLFDITVRNQQKIGSKVYADIPIELLMIDEAYQRVGTYHKDKVARLVTEFDVDKMDTLVVSIHEEEKRFYIVDGMHRFFAALKRGITSLNCEIKFFNGDFEERRKAEARYFIGQYILTDPLSAIDQHNGRVLLGEEIYVTLDEVVNAKEEIHFKDNNNKGRQKPGTLTGYVEASKIARYGKEFLSDVFDILISAKWSIAGTGLSNYSLRMVADVYVVHRSPEVKAEMARILREVNPKLFRAKAQGKYFMRTQSNANALYLEDLVCTNLNIPRLIDVDIPRFNPTTDTMEAVVETVA